MYNDTTPLEYNTIPIYTFHPTGSPISNNLHIDNFHYANEEQVPQETFDMIVEPQPSIIFGSKIIIGISVGTILLILLLLYIYFVNMNN